MDARWKESGRPCCCCARLRDGAAAPSSVKAVRGVPRFRAPTLADPRSGVPIEERQLLLFEGKQFLVLFNTRPKYLDQLGESNGLIGF